MAVIPALGKLSLEAVQQVWAQPALHSVFQASGGYIGSLYLKQTNNTYKGA